jgi:hypothetical protein
MDIRSSGETLKVISRGGVNEINQECAIPGYPGQVWFDSNGVANIIGLRNLIRHYDVTYDSSGDNCFHVWKNDVSILTFKPSEGGLWYYDASVNKAFSMLTTLEDKQEAFSLLTTVKESQKKYTLRGVRQAEVARRLQEIVMRPPSKKLQHILARGFIRNCPVESRHVQYANDIYGKNLGAIKGKTVRREVKPLTVSSNEVPEEILSRYRDVTLSVDIMFVNSLPFLVALSKELRIGHAVPLTSRHDTVIARELKAIILKYEMRGFRITQVRAEGEFQKLEAHINVHFEFCCKRRSRGNRGKVH